MNPARKRGILIGGAALVIVVVVVAFFVLNSGNTPAPAAAVPSAQDGPAAGDPKSAIAEYLQDLSENNTDAASRLTDDPAAAAVALRDARNALNPTKLAATLAELKPTAAGEKKTSGTLSMAWTLKPGQVWTYEGSFDVVLPGASWRVHWTPALLHPKLEAGQRLSLSTAVADTTAVVDRDGKPLIINGASGPRPAEGFAAPLLRQALVDQVTGAKSSGFAVVRVDSKGVNLETLFGKAEDDGAKPLKSTLSAAVQQAAQSTVDGYQGSAMLVAIQPSTGGILAVAQNSAAGTTPRALNGLYAPGSTGKIVTATAAIDAGLVTADASVECPGTAHIGTRTISNEDQFDLGTVTAHKAFAKSCNTTFGKLASQLPPDGLKKAADKLGLNADFEIPGVSTEAGKVEAAVGNDELVEDGIGQGKVLVSPFGEAMMAATVAAGKAIQPKLWDSSDALKTQTVTGYSAPSGATLGQVRRMMREVVTGGTATGLAHSGEVFGKTGTSQFGSGESANGWFVGYREDLAFAILLENANSSTPAVGLGAKFLGKL